MNAPELNPDIARLLAKAGLLQAGQRVTIAPLSGGVSCEAWRATTDEGDYAVKVALPQLRVAAEWFAPVERAETEARWFEEAARIVPGGVPELIAVLPDEHALVTAFVPAPVWKQDMIEGRVDPGVAAKVGAMLAAIHRATADDPRLAEAFADHAAFRALRIEPFLLYTAEHHPAVAAILRELAKLVGARREALVHGDVSPKNILLGMDGPILLDAECAVYGDPAFDVAFCVTHLLLKSVWLAPRREALIASARALVASYATPDIEPRLGLLVPALLLARIDGRSPADYIVNDDLKHAIRTRAIAMLQHPAQHFAGVLADWTEDFE